MARSKTTAPARCPDYIEASLAPLIVPIDSLKPDPENPKPKTEKALAVIAESLKAYKQQRAITANRAGVIIAGNGVWQAAKEILGWEWIACARSTLQGKRARNYAVMDNRSSELSQLLPERILAVDPSAGPIGFTPEQLDKLKRVGSAGGEGEVATQRSGARFSVGVTGAELEEIEKILERAKIEHLGDNNAECLLTILRMWNTGGET